MDIYSELDALITTHPNFVAIWKHYIELKKSSLETTIQTCKENIQNIQTPNINDLTVNNINILILLSNTLTMK
jgi:hypothetical protein